VTPGVRPPGRRGLLPLRGAWIFPAELFSFVRFDIERHLLRRRWLLPAPTALFVAHMAIGGTVPQSARDAFSYNAWDALFGVFANGNVILYVMTPLLLYLVSDLLPEPEFVHMVLLRLGSRRRWWVGKSLTLAVAVLGYLALTVGLVAVVAGFVLPWRASWSPGARQYTGRITIPRSAMSIPPAAAFGQLLVLLALGWFCLGLVTLLATQAWKRSVLGLLAGISVLATGLLTVKGDVPPPYAYFSIAPHLLFGLHSFGEVTAQQPRLASSIIYWVTGIVLLFAAGLRLSARQDFSHRGS
jgi:hypothetical protein